MMNYRWEMTSPRRSCCLRLTGIESFSSTDLVETYLIPSRFWRTESLPRDY